MTTISEDVQIADLRKLAANVVMQAIRDARKASLEKRLDAVLWLSGQDFPWWAEWAGMPLADALPLLTSGKLRRLRRLATRGRT